MQAQQNIASPAHVGQKLTNQTISVLLQVDGERMMIRGAPLQYVEDDADTEEVQVLPILKFIEKKGQRIDGKITHLVKDGEDQTQLPSLIGIYNARDAG